MSIQSLNLSFFLEYSPRMMLGSQNMVTSLIMGDYLMRLAKLPLCEAKVAVVSHSLFSLKLFKYSKSETFYRVTLFALVLLINALENNLGSYNVVDSLANFYCMDSLVRIMETLPTILLVRKCLSHWQNHISTPYHQLHSLPSCPGDV